MEQERLGKADWLRAARSALLHGGPVAVRVETLARTLKVTKGSFYWHFKDRQELLEELLLEWEAETSLLRDLLARGDFRAGLRDFFDELQRRVISSEKGDSPSDAAIFAWAAVSPKVALRANREEKKRIALLVEAVGDPGLAEYIYLAYLGFLVRRRRVPEAAKTFSRMAALSSELMLRNRKGRK
jgi:AcrR family transcriptional regulator